MKVLILTCNTGQGHNSATAALIGAFARRGVSCDAADALRFLPSGMSDFISGWHTRIYRYLPWMFKKGYSFAESHPALFDDQRGIYKLLASGVDGLRELVIREKYDTLICVHVFSALMVTEMLRREGLPLHTAFVATDYTCSPSAGDSRLDRYYIPHEDLKAEFAANGVPMEKLVASGIPVREEFYDCPDRDEARARLGLSVNGGEVLLMCGSMGCGPMEELADSLDSYLPAGAELTVICGTNEKLAQALESRPLLRTRVLRYTDDMPLWLSAVDLLLTKPGGLSITEAATVGTPMLFLDSVGGCETRNRLFFTAENWARAAGDADEMVELTCSMMRYGVHQDRDALRAAFSRNAADVIAEDLIRLAGA